MPNGHRPRRRCSRLCSSRSPRSRSCTSRSFECATVWRSSRMRPMREAWPDAFQRSVLLRGLRDRDRDVSPVRREPVLPASGDSRSRRARVRKGKRDAKAGIAYLVGAGPGDPGLLTVRGRELLDECDAIVHDALANPALLVRAETEGPAPDLFDVGKRGGDERSASQDAINGLLVRLVREGKRVVRLKGGDPLVFGRGGEEAQALAEADLPFEIVPGITSGIAAAAYAGIPVTHRGLSTSVTFVTGHEDPDKTAPQADWSAIARTGGTIVVYMGVKSLPRIAASLMDAGLP